jgi:hypothetical protein
VAAVVDDQMMIHQFRRVADEGFNDVLFVPSH